MVEFDPYSREHTDDPYPTYRRLRDEAPVYHNERMNFWAVSRYEDVSLLFRDHPHFISGEGVTLEGNEKGTIGYLLLRDPPDHTWHKGLMTKVFSISKMAGLEPFIRRRAIALLDGLAGKDEIDFVDAFSWRLPLEVISELLDIPHEFHDELHYWTSVYVLRGADAKPELQRESLRRRLELLKGLIAERRKNPGEDAISRLMQTEVLDDEGRPRTLSDNEIAYGFSELSNAGHETVARALPNSLIAFHKFPDQRRKLQKDPGLMASAIEELLRFDPPSQYQGRGASCDFELHGVKIPKGARIAIITASAVHDERVFEDPETLNIERKPDQRSIYFGHGIHKCLGVHLARLEMRVVLEELLARYPDYEVDPARATRSIISTLRGVNNLPMRPGAHA